MTAEATTLELLVGPRDANHLSLRPRRRAPGESAGFWDGNWLEVDVAVRAGAFQGAFQAELRADELGRLLAQLVALQGAAEGAATLESAEGWVSLRLALDRRGRLEGTCTVRDDPAGGCSLRFDVGADRGQLPALVAALEEILRAFPVVGDPEEEEGPRLGDDPELDEA